MLDSDARETFLFASWIELQYILTQNRFLFEKGTNHPLFLDEFIKVTKTAKVEQIVNLRTFRLPWKKTQMESSTKATCKAHDSSLKTNVIKA